LARGDFSTGVDDESTGFARFGGRFGGLQRRSGFDLTNRKREFAICVAGVIVIWQTSSIRQCNRFAIGSFTQAPLCQTDVPEITRSRTLSTSAPLPATLTISAHWNL
jgi:hypothetical protein